MAILILFAACWLGGYLFPWWWPALAAYAVGAWLRRRGSAACLQGFVGVGAAWAVAAGWRDLRNHHILAARMAALFHLPVPAAALAATALVGGLMGAFGAWAGYALRAWLWPRPANRLLPDRAEARNAAAEAAGSESSGAALRPDRAEARDPRPDDPPAAPEAPPLS